MNEQITIINRTYEDICKVIQIASKVFTLTKRNLCADSATKFKYEEVLYDIQFTKRKLGWTWIVKYGKGEIK